MKPLLEHSEGFTLDSPVPLHWLLWVVFACTCLFLWHSLRQWRAAKRAWLLPFLAGLRVLTVAALAAMVAGPSSTQTSRQTTRQGVTLLVDSSASMSLGEAEAHTQEWAQARPADPALGSLTAAMFHLQILTQLPAQQLATRAGYERVGDAAIAIRNALATLTVEDDAVPLRRQTTILAALAEDLTQGRSVVLADAQRCFTESLAAIRACLPKLQPAPAPAMAQDDKAPTKRRLERVADWLTAAGPTWLAECRKTFDVELIEVGDAARPITPATLAALRKRDPQYAPHRTDLAAVLEEAGRAASLAHSRAVVIISDGAHNAERNAAEAAARLRGLPLLFVPIGASLALEQKDLALSQATAPRSVFLHDTIQIEPQISAIGFDGATVDVLLKEGDVEMDRQQVRVQNGVADRALTFQWKPSRLGAHSLTLEAVPLPGDTFTSNNKQVLPIDVLDDRMSLLVADSEPRWETRYLLNLLKRDERMAFTAMLAAPLAKADGKPVIPPSLPTTSAQWAQYRVVILGDVATEQLDTARQEGLVNAITEAGGTLIIVAGSEAMPAAYAGQLLGSLLPVISAPLPESIGFGVRLGASAERFPLIQLADSPQATNELWQRITTKLPLYNLTPYSVAKPQATVLLEAVPHQQLPGAAVKRTYLCYQDVGKGRVVFLSAPASWHLRYTEGDTFHFRFWGQLIHWAVARDMETGSRCVRLSTATPSVKQDAPLKVTLALQNLLGQPTTGAACEAVVMAQGKEWKVSPFVEDSALPGTYHATLSDLPLGPVNIVARGEAIAQLFQKENRQGVAELTATVTPIDNRELRDLLRDQAQLRRLAQASEGALLPPHALPAALLHLGLRPSVIESTARQPLWNEWPMLLAVLGLLALEWSLRRVAGVL